MAVHSPEPPARVLLSPRCAAPEAWTFVLAGLFVMWLQSPAHAQSAPPPAPAGREATSKDAPDPGDATGYLTRARARMAKGDLEGASFDYDRAISLDSGNVHAFHQRRDLRLRLGEFKGSLDDAIHAVNLAPQDPLAYRDRGMNYMLVRQWPEALADYRNAIALGEKSDDVHLYVWLIRTRLGEAGADAELAEWLAKLKPDSWSASMAGYSLGKVSEEKLLAASKVPDPKEARRLQCQAWYFIGMKKLFARDRFAVEGLARCIMDDQMTTPEMHLAVVELGVVARPPHPSPEEALARFIEAIPFKNGYTSQSDEHSVTLLSKVSNDGTPQGHEAVLDFYGPIAWHSDVALEDHLLAQIKSIRKQVPIGPYLEKDHIPSDNVVHFIEVIEGVPVGFIKYWVNIPKAPTSPSVVNAVIIKDQKQYTFTLTTVIPETQESYRQDERLMIETLIKSGKL